ncbi:MAG TPA: class I SAM-dependent methyltransferase, partial [Rectinemataceae bacterium]|nr:class I SAM-dependent methyltransferase [Rectinemataceae bacterium]
MNEKDKRQAEYFRNRLVKNERHLRRWARREGIQAFRLYDNDIPEIPLAVELFRDTRRLDPEGPSEDCLVLALYERPYEKDAAEEEAWLALMADSAAEALSISRDLVFLRTRKRQKGLSQYERRAGKGAERRVIEGGLSFIVNFTEYLDTGLFLDHRPTRARIRDESGGRRVLNLFSYTGSFSVYAAAGGATAV